MKMDRNEIFTKLQNAGYSAIDALVIFHKGLAHLSSRARLEMVERLVGLKTDEKEPSQWEACENAVVHIKHHRNLNALSPEMEGE
jgi:hypothetical protein